LGGYQEKTLSQWGGKETFKERGTKSAKKKFAKTPDGVVLVLTRHVPARRGIKKLRRGKGRGPRKYPKKKTLKATASETTGAARKNSPKRVKMDFVKREVQREGKKTACGAAELFASNGD